MLQRKAVFISIACIVLAALTFVTPVLGTSQAFAQTKPLLKVRISKIPIANYVPADVALSRGWFKEEGLDVNIEGIMTGTLAMGALVAGKLDIVYETFLVGLKARAQGFDVVIVSNCCNAGVKVPDSSAILVRKDTGIKSLKDLEGKRVLVQTLQNINWAYAREAITRAGGDPGKVHFLELPFPQMVDSLLGGQADAVYTVEPFTTIGIGTGKLSALSYPHVAVQPGLNIAGYLARGAWVKEHPEAAAAFRRAIQRAIDFLEQNPQEKTNAILKFTSLKPDLLARITQDKWTTRVDPADLRKQLELYNRHGMIDKTFDVKAMIVP